ncbi:MAG TPA: hypothetical protein VK929_06600 [Longimicrobiales bacterium]|nr:hypothetical protein [Longimicrobiales bacterium]
MNTTVRTAARSSFEMLQEKLRHTVETGGPALVDPHMDGVERLDQKLRTLDSLCRETFQETLSDAYALIAGKLEAGEALTPGEHKAVELLFTGEATYYLKTENNFHDWIAELNRLLDEMAALEADGLDNLAELMHLQALCRDAMHVTPEVIYYLRERQRVEQFRASLEGDISREGGRLLARMIRDLMASPHR